MNAGVCSCRFCHRLMTIDTMPHHLCLGLAELAFALLDELLEPTRKMFVE
jgi:hypothetical protein